MQENARNPSWSPLDPGTDPARMARSERIAAAVTDYAVTEDPYWPEVTARWPRVSYFATDLDPRSFERKPDGTWDGRAELLLTAPGELRPGQEEQISFTLPVDVELFEQNGSFSIKTFDFKSALPVRSGEWR